MFSEQLSCCERSYLCDKKQGQLLTQGKLNTLHKIKIEFVIINWLKMKFVTLPRFFGGKFERILQKKNDQNFT